MFGLLPLLRGLLYFVGLLVALGIGGWLAARLGGLALRGLGIDWAELRRFKEQRRQYEFQRRGLEVQLAEQNVQSEQFEQLCLNLQALQAASPQPPRWAFWLR